MGVDEFFRLRARLVELARSVDADPPSIGVLSTGEACAVALLPEWEKVVRDLHASGWRQ